VRVPIDFPRRQRRHFALLYLWKTSGRRRLAVSTRSAATCPPGNCWVAILVLTSLLIAWKGWRHGRGSLSGWFWYIRMLVPVIGLVQVGDQAMADRYTYLR
jgi:hypothetical protein